MSSGNVRARNKKKPRTAGGGGEELIPVTCHHGLSTRSLRVKQPPVYELTWELKKAIKKEKEIHPTPELM